MAGGGNWQPLLRISWERVPDANPTYLLHSSAWTELGVDQISCERKLTLAHSEKGWQRQLTVLWCHSFQKMNKSPSTLLIENMLLVAKHNQNCAAKMAWPEANYNQNQKEVVVGTTNGLSATGIEHSSRPEVKLAITSSLSFRKTWVNLVNLKNYLVWVAPIDIKVAQIDYNERAAVKINFYYLVPWDSQDPTLQNPPLPA